MNSTIKVLASSTVTGVALAGLVAAPAFACTPKGKITKYVQNQTTGSEMVDANTAADALVVHPGDTLVYTIVIANDGGDTKDNADAMVETVMNDELPTGVTPVKGSNSIKEDIGTINERSKVTKAYTVTVDKNVTDGQVITNKACYTGEATDHNKKMHQEACDVAVVKVTVPETPDTPETPETPETPSTPQVESTATELPNTGVGSLVLPAGIAGGLGYAGNLLRLKRKQR